MTPTWVGGEPDAVRVPHQLGHPLGETAQVAVELLDLPRRHAQHGVGVLADLAERDPPARLRLAGRALSFRTSACLVPVESAPV